MENSKFKLPRTFQTNNPKYVQYNGMPKVSYSQISSWTDPTYRSEYIRNYIVGIPSPGNIWTDFGSAVGTYIESIGTSNPDVHSEYSRFLSESDRETLSGIDYPEGSVYEDHLVLNVDDLFVIEGYADRVVYDSDLVSVTDFKTGNIQKKSFFYGSDDYMQTQLYAYILSTQGYKIKSCDVWMFGRKGNGSERHPVRLSGEILVIPTPYDQEKVQEYLKKVKKSAREISEYYTKFREFFGEFYSVGP